MRIRPLRRRHLLSAAALFAMASPASATDFVWSDGAFASLALPNPLQPPHTLTILPSVSIAKTYYAVSWTNESAVSHTADTIHGGSAALNNAGLWDLQDDTATFVHSAGNQPSFVNTGTLRKSAGAASNFGSWVFFSNAGAVEAQVGVLSFNSGSVVINGGTSFLGAGTVRMSGGASFNGGFAADNLEFGAGNFSGNSARLTGGVAGNGSMRWVGGALYGSWEFDAGTTLVAVEGGVKQLAAVDFVNHGTMLWQSTNDLFGGSSTLTNNGLFEAQADSRLVYNLGNRPVLLNNGTLRAAAGVTFTNHSFALVNNGGTLDAAAGGAIVYEGGANFFNAGTKFTGEGRHLVVNDARFVDDHSAANLVLQAGIFYGGDGITAGSKAIAQGSATWTGGQFRGLWETAGGHTLTVLDGGVKQLAAVDFVNHGTVLWQSTDALNGASSTLTNNGRFEVHTDADLAYNAGNRPVLVNNGLFIKSDGGGETSLASVVLFNSGTIDVRSGSIRLPDGFVNDGTLAGTGTLATSVLTNAGRVAPGTSPGTLSIDGHFVQTPAGFLEIDIGTLLVGSDLLLVSGSAALEGTLALRCFADCQLDVGDEFVILDSVGDLSGTFAGGTTLTGFATGAFEVIFDADVDQVLLRVTETVTAVPEPGTWVLMLGGLVAVRVLSHQRRA